MRAMRRAVVAVALSAAAVVAGCTCGGEQPPPLEVLPGPASLTAVPADGKVTLSWPPVARAVSYVVYAASAPEVGKDSWTALPASSRTPAGASPSAVTGLANGTTYYFVVTAVGRDGEGGASPEVSSTPEQDCACQGWQVCNASRECVAPAGTGAYLPGANYHALSNHWTENQPVPVLDDVFLPNYHVPGVRDAVRAQLAEMTAAGVRVVKTPIWFADEPSDQQLSWAMDFPPSPQQLLNLRTYVADVATTPTADGTPFELYLSDHWLGAADFSFDTPATTLGYSFLSAEEYTARMVATMDSELDAIRGVYRSDGMPAVSVVYGLSEFCTCATDDDADPVCTWPGDSRYFHNSAWFMQSFYPHFVAKARSVGVIPSVYFLPLRESESVVLDPTWQDPYLPAVNGHHAFALMYRALRFMKRNGLPLPERIDFTTGVAEPMTYTTTATVIARLYDDLLALLPEFQTPPFRFGAAEVIAWADPDVQMERGKPFASEALLGRGLEYAAYWNEADFAPPTWDMRPLETDDVDVPFASLDPGFEDQDLATMLPAGWAADPPGPTSASRAVVDDAHGGTAVLRLGGTCGAGCGGVISDPMPVTAGRVALVRFWARSAIPEAGARPPSPDYAGMTVEVRGSSGGADVGALVEFGTVATAWTWRRFAGVVPIPPGVDALRLRFALQNAGSALADVDDLH